MREVAASTLPRKGEQHVVPSGQRAGTLAKQNPKDYLAVTLVCISPKQLSNDLM